MDTHVKITREWKSTLSRVQSFPGTLAYSFELAYIFSNLPYDSDRKL